jgi:hypothetical protein
MADWTILGKDVPPVYHGGRRKIRKVDPEKVQSRDHGFYGAGFYVTTKESYARTYGPVLSKFRFTKDARILDTRIAPWDAPSKLIQAVFDHIEEKWIEAARSRGKVIEFYEELRRITEFTTDWAKAVDEFATDFGFDAVMWSPGEIVVKNPDVLLPVRTS